MNTSFQKPTPAFGENRLNLGLQGAAAAVLFWGLLLAINNYLLSSLHLNPVLYSCLTLFYAAVGLYLYSGFGKISIETFKNYRTWVFGFGRIILLSLVNIALLTLTATEIEFIQRFGILFSMLLVWILLGRKPYGAEWPGILLMLGAFGVVIWRLEPSAVFAFWISVIAACLNAALALVVELHPQSNKVIGLKERCHYTAAMIGASCLVFITFIVLVSLILPTQYMGNLGTALERTALIGDFNELLNWRIHATSFLVGIFLMAPVVYARFYTIRMLGSDNTLLAGTLIPFAALSFESILSLFGLIDMSSLSAADLALGILITIGAIFTLVIRVSRPQENTKTDT